MPFLFSEVLLKWFDQHGRKTLPWQKPISAYRVWISEIMLQQTQVKTVIPYFQRFIDRFPTLKILAQAQEDEVLSYWSGLGYYARGRNLYKTAIIVQTDFKGKFPMDLQALQTLPGIGRSTAGAILSIVGNQCVPILDGNVKRVLTRLHGIKRWPGEPEALKKLWKIAEEHTPAERVADYTQAIMDFGAMVCVRKPECNKCPFTQKCIAFQSGEPHLYPVKKKKKNLPVRSTSMLILRSADQIFLKKRASSGLWGGLWSFPETDMPEKNFKWLLKEDFDCELLSMQQLQNFRHTFTHFHLDINPYLINVRQNDNVIREDQTYAWHNIKNLKIAVPTPVKQLIEVIGDLK